MFCIDLLVILRDNNYKGSDIVWLECSVSESECLSEG